MMDFVSRILAFSIFITLVAGVALVVTIPIVINPNPEYWHCTASRVVNDTLPKVEECIKYERKE